ncbi:sce7726 family protein [Paenibacillus alkalitolerans]|uniref:sce7726 family protein n=1 Tax=Paenibacillus alkalitolerans TaxID=2799335 RepID=UPI0018F28C2F|nr:sce7726 family protein [Paenibacillus alkalitolerans]
MSTDNSILLNRVFTRNTLREIVERSYSDVFATAIRRYVVDSSGKDNKQLLSELYTVLKKEYRNEYYYKNTILNKLLLGVHKPTTTTALTEISIGKSKADFVLINGRAVVYEIKTELDNLDRLDTQISNYFNAFTRVSVLASEEYVDTLEKRLGNSPVGICILTKRGNISEKKEPQEYTDKLNKDTMFRILRKSEYEEIIIKHFGMLPDVSQFEYYRVCKRLFCEIKTDEVYTDFISILKKRVKIDIEPYKKIPYELKFLVYFSDFKSDEYKKLQLFLEQKEVIPCTSLF